MDAIRIRLSKEERSDLSKAVRDRSRLYCSCGAKNPTRSGRSDRRFRFGRNDSGFPPLLFKPFKTNTYEACPIISALTPFRINTSGSVHSKALYPLLKSTLLKNRGRGWPVIVNQKSGKDFCPEEHRDERTSLACGEEVSVPNPPRRRNEGPLLIPDTSSDFDVQTLRR
jgi:hypothetical protein